MVLCCDDALDAEMSVFGASALVSRQGRRTYDVRVHYEPGVGDYRSQASLSCLRVSSSLLRAPVTGHFGSLS
jgi:hypothetical protein